MKKLSIILGIAAITGLASCEDKIDVNVPEGKSYPVLDAWITNEKGAQSIRFTKSVPYTTQGEAPIIKDAEITLTDETINKKYTFAFKDGAYTYDPGANATIGVLGHAYRLRVVYQGEIFEATDSIRRVPAIDSITYEFKKKDESYSGKEGYFAKFHAKDLANGTDYYWIRSYRNNTRNRVEDNFSIDGYFDEGVSNGASFITPITEGITDYDKPFQLGEKVIIRLLSVSKSNHDFLIQVDQQLNSGGLFATILENVKTNMLNTTTGGKLKMLGRFGMSSVTYGEKEVK